MQGHTMGVPVKHIQVCTVHDPSTQVHLSRTVLYSIQYMIHYMGLVQSFHIHSYLQEKPRASPQPSS